MASLSEIKAAGLEVSPSSSGDQILGLLSKVPEQIEKRRQKEKDDVMEQVKLYGELRKNGYSPEDAHARVTRTYRSTGFIEKLLGGGSPAFDRPKGEDSVSLEQQKTRADIAKTKADTRQSVAKAGYYQKGGAKGRNYDGLTPNQIQMRIKDLRNQLGMGDDEDDANINTEITYLNELFNKKSGFRETTPGAGGSQATTVIMKGPDGKQYKIPKQNMTRALERGFKEIQPVR